MGNEIQMTPFIIDGDRAGDIVEFWHPEYCMWAYNAIYSFNGKVASQSFFDREEAEAYLQIKHKKNTQTFSQRLSDAISGSEYTHDQISKEIGCSSVAISKWKSGDTYPAVHFLYRLSVLLEIGQDRFIEWVEQIEQEKK
jgi:hypothetical protein